MGDAHEQPNAEFRRLQHWYTPKRVEIKLRLMRQVSSRKRCPEDRFSEDLPLIYARRPIHEDERGMPGHRRLDNPIEERMGEVGLLLWALDHLGLFAREVVEVCVISDVPYRVFAEKKGVSIGHISNTKRRAMEDMAYLLGWSPEDNS